MSNLEFQIQQILGLGNRYKAQKLRNEQEAKTISTNIENYIFEASKSFEDINSKLPNSTLETLYTNDKKGIAKLLNIPSNYELGCALDLSIACAVKYENQTYKKSFYYLIGSLITKDVDFIIQNGKPISYNMTIGNDLEKCLDEYYKKCYGYF